MESSIISACSTAVASVQLTHFELATPYESLVEERDFYLVDMCMMARPPNTRACYRKHWRSQQYKPLGSIYMVPPGEPLQVYSEPGTTTAISCALRQPAMAEWLGRELSWHGRALENTLDVSSTRIRWLLGQLAQELDHPGFGHTTFVELAAAQIALELARLCTETEQSAGASGLSPWRLRLIDERLAELGAAPTIAELAALCRMSGRQLMRGFQISRGCSLGVYVTRRRIELAKGLLAKGDHIKAIAHALGFSSPSSFIYAFRRETSLSPRKYREQIGT